MSVSLKPSLRSSVLYAVLITAFGIAASAALLATAPTPEKKETTSNTPSVAVISMDQKPITLTIASSGILRAKKKIDISAEVGGKVIYTAPNFAAGSKFSTGDILLKIDPRDYQISLVQAHATLASAKHSLLQAKENARLAKEDWKQYGKNKTKGKPSLLTLHVPQLEQAHSLLESAKAQVQQAELNLVRTEIRMPFDGFLENKTIDAGQVVSANEKLATVFSSNVMEVVLPVSAQDIAHLDEGAKSRLLAGQIAPDIPVLLEPANWPDGSAPIPGTIVRLERTLDPRTRLFNLVAEIQAPFTRADTSAVATGMFVTAEIEGKVINNASLVPLASVIDDKHVLVVTGDNTIDLRSVEILQKGERSIVVKIEDFQDSDKLVSTPPKTYFSGMHVAPNETQTSVNQRYAQKSGALK